VKILVASFGLFFNIWFYFINLVVILVLFPFIFITSLSPKGYRYFFHFERIWAKMVLLLCGFIVKTTWHQKPKKNTQYIICTNHTSMIDIMLTLAVFKTRFLFIGKKELGKMPLLGYFYKRTNLLVDRSSMSSRKQVFHEAALKLDEGEDGLCIYPEGLAPREDITLAPFKMGAFKLAADKNVTIIPATFLDCKKRLPFDIFKGSPGILRVIVHPFLNPQENSSAEATRLKEACYQSILQPLQVQEFSHEKNN
jgi:1-acyl-sn-glycerol-3-phosphate acyltransferase